MEFLYNFVHKFVYIHVSEHFSLAKIIHPPDRCGISRSWLNSMIITQVHLVLGTIKWHSKMCSFATQHNATAISSFERACNWHADCRNVHQSCFPTISRLQCHFREFFSTSNWPHNHRTSLTMPAQDLHIQLVHLWDCLRLATWKTIETEEYFCL